MEIFFCFFFIVEKFLLTARDAVQRGMQLIFCCCTIFRHIVITTTFSGENTVHTDDVSAFFVRNVDHMQLTIGMKTRRIETRFVCLVVRDILRQLGLAKV